MPERITRQVRLSQSSSRFVTPTWIIFSSLTENCLASGCHISKSQRLLNLLRAPREVDWGRHLSAKRQMVLWCFAYDDLNYSRYLSSDLSNVSHPEDDHQKLGNTLRLEDSPSSKENETPLEKFLLTKHAKRLSIKIHNRWGHQGVLL